MIARRAPWWLSTWAIVVAIVGSRLFGMLPVWQAMIGQGILWGVLALLIRASSTQPFAQPVADPIRAAH